MGVRFIHLRVLGRILLKMAEGRHVGVLALACRVVSAQRFARCAGSLRFSTFCALAKLAAHASRAPLRQRSLHRKMSAMLGCTDSPKRPDKPAL